MLGSAILITAIGYLIDYRDDHYANNWYTVLEFTLITSIFFSFIALIYLIVCLIKRLKMKKINSIDYNLKLSQKGNVVAKSW
jgi:hypothetical protein